jgi:Tfp pilus assembly protein PilP
MGMSQSQAAAEGVTAPAAVSTPAPGNALSEGFPSAEEIKKIRDPFKRPDAEASLAATPRSDLEKYQVDAFKMVAVVTGPTRMRAMLQAPDGKTFMVAERARIGLRNGVVTKITSDAVCVRERVMNVLGEEENVDSEIRLKPETRSQAASATQ